MIKELKTTFCKYWNTMEYENKFAYLYAILLLVILTIFGVGAIVYIVFGILSAFTIRYLLGFKSYREMLDFSNWKKNSKEDDEEEFPCA
jgi:hypothetical protein